MLQNSAFRVGRQLYTEPIRYDLDRPYNNLPPLILPSIQHNPLIQKYRVSVRLNAVTPTNWFAEGSEGVTEKQDVLVKDFICLSPSSPKQINKRIRLREGSNPTLQMQNHMLSLQWCRRPSSWTRRSSQYIRGDGYFDTRVWKRLTLYQFATHLLNASGANLGQQTRWPSYLPTL